MDKLAITREEYEDLWDIQPNRRRDRPFLWFSTNSQGDIWPGETLGLTPVGVRENVRGRSQLLDRVADEYLRVRDGGGRFFLSNLGAFYKDESGNEIRFLEFDLRI